MRCARMHITLLLNKRKIKNEIYLNKIISLGKENGIELIFVKTPCSTTIENHKKYNHVKSIVEAYNYKYLNYN